jgi:hypothetical protein
MALKFTQVLPARSSARALSNSDSDRPKRRKRRRAVRRRRRVVRRNSNT